LRRAEQQRGTIVSVDVRELVDSELVDDMFAWFQRVDDLFMARGEMRVEDAQPKSNLYSPLATR
jgi:hypothetical protein